MIVKTRPLGETSGTSVVVTTDGVGPARGLLRRRPEAGRFWHSRTAAPPELRGLVEHFWIVRWDLGGGPPQTRETLPHPNVHLVVSPNDSRVMGVQSGRFVRVLEGAGQVFGIKLKPGGLYPWFRKPVRELTDRSMPLRELFGPAADALESSLMSGSDDRAMIEVAVDFLCARLPDHDPAVAHASAIVAGIVDDRSINSVDELVRRNGLGKRALQRLFKQYVGVSPKWVINRYRLHEAVEQLIAGVRIDWATLALNLGYFDQAHFIRDFKSLVGRAPTEFLRDEGT
jgi:AraC-like DNA-binding protein